MPFQPGHTINVGNPGVSAEFRRQARSLASAIRTRNDPDAICAWLECIRDGFDPASSDRVTVVVDLKTRMDAQRMLLERGWGQPTQHAVIEGLIRSEQHDADTSAPRAPLTLAEINARREKLRLAVAPKIIDVESK